MFLTCSYSIYIGYVIFIRYRYIVSKQVTTSIRSTSINICSDVQKIYIIFVWIVSLVFFARLSKFREKGVTHKMFKSNTNCSFFIKSFSMAKVEEILTTKCSKKKT